MIGRSRKASISDVAAKARVSTATVSRVLSGARDKDDDIARRVRKAAETLHYSVDFAASALRGSSSGTIGLLVPDGEDSFAAQFAAELETVANDSGREIYLGFFGADGSRLDERIHRILARRCDGIAIVAEHSAVLPPSLKEQASQVPIIQVGGGAPPLHVNWVGVDAGASMRLVFDLLVQKGASHVGYIGPNPSGTNTPSETIHKRSGLTGNGTVSTNNIAPSNSFASFSQCAEQTDMTYDPEWVMLGDGTVGEAHTTMTEKLAKLGKGLTLPDAIICADDMLARGVLLACAQNDVRIPEDLLVVGYGDSAAATLTYPSLTSIHPPFELMADETLRIVENGHAKGMHGWLATHVALAPKIIERDSTNRPGFGSSDMAEPSNE